MLKLNQTLQKFIANSTSFRFAANLKNINWFQVGGNADLLFRPKDSQELQEFLKIKGDLAIFVMGVGSNIIIRDKGFRGCVIRLGKGFIKKEILQNNRIMVGAANLDLNIALFAAQHNIAGLEFLSGIPGTIGGAVKMNAGAYGGEISDILEQACGYDLDGTYHEFNNQEMNYKYRISNPPTQLIYTHAILSGKSGKAETIKNKIAEIQKNREASQPLRHKTGGSSFKNPAGYKAWELIDKAGCRGLKIGDAIMSEKHCNFMINQGNATAADLENLGNMVKNKVKESCNISLEWEIKIIGEK